MQRYPKYSQVNELVVGESKHVQTNESSICWFRRSRSWQLFKQQNTSPPLSNLLKLLVSPPWCSSHLEYKCTARWISKIKWNTKVSTEELNAVFPLSSNFSCEVVLFPHWITLAYLTIPDMPSDPYYTKIWKAKLEKTKQSWTKKRDWTYILRPDQIQWHLHACSKSSVANRGAAPRRTATASSYFKSQAKFNGVKPEQILTPTEPDKLIETFHRFQPQFAKVFYPAMITTYWNWNHSDWVYSRTSYTLISSHNTSMWKRSGAPSRRGPSPQS